ncbi:MaoC family dehydratase [Caulobacter sp. NIBR2454]|uniref:MaoC family dehydratase n=1 Tax=Caulobacter sp. NIBR2454 TaxID=3015996 RepID=UPI0022B6996B|nr:MaoC family dehydratase [Caulobacter sp. NIBR2454]
MKSHFLEDLSVGMSAQTTNLVTEDVIQKFAAVSGDTNPVHLDAEFAAGTSFGERIAHGMLSGAYISAAIGTNLPGPGAIYISQSMSFKRPVKIGAEVVTRVEITAIDEAKARVTFATVCTVNGKAVVDGEAVVMVPRRSA